MAERRYKVVPIIDKTNDEKIRELRTYLAAGVDVNIADNNLEKAAAFQEHLDIFELLVANAADRLSI